MSARHYAIRVRSGGRTIVSTEDFPIYENEISFLFGESGIGKSVLSKAVYGILDTDHLNVSINGKPYSSHKNDLWTNQIRENGFFVFQEPSSHLNPLMTISSQLNEGSLRGIDEKKILDYLWQTQNNSTLTSVLDIYPKPYRPSGGEKQRILLVMAFKRIDAFLQSKIQEPAFFVFDEPTGSLDNRYRDIFLKLLFQKYAVRPFTIQIITHDYSIISEIYRSYKPLQSKVHFKELTRTGDANVSIRDFSADEYLSWLTRNRRPAALTYKRTDPVLEIDSSFSIFGKEHHIYKDQNKTVPNFLILNKGDIVYLKAPSGVGKTTLAKIIMGLYEPEKFRMNLCGVTYNERTPRETWDREIWGKRAGMVFQHADESLDMESSVKETFDGLQLENPLSLQELKTRLSELFDSVSDSFLNKKVKFLSGGQKQRLNLLRTLVLDTKLIIFDEPLNGLDFSSVKKVLTLLDLQKSKGSSILMISHNEEIFENFINKDNIFYLS